MYTTHPAPPPPGVSRFLSLTSNQQSSTPHSTTSHASSSSTYTPIKVRGKKRKLPITTHTPKILQQHQPKKIKRSLALVMEAHATNPRLTLDTLPAEILENILLYSTNLSLPKAHPLIGLKLSQKATLIRLFIWAFHETWDGWFGFPTAKTLLGPHINVHGKEQTTVDGDHDLQTALLRQPWATTDFILQAQQTWAESYGRGRWYQHSLPWNEEPIDLKHSHHGGHCHFDSRKCFEVDYQQALKWAPFQSSSYPWGYQDVHPKAQAPTDLLTGPWNDEQLRRLFWLTRGGLMGFNARGDNAPSWEIKLQFLRNAILDVSEVNVLAVNCLMCNNVCQDIPRDILMKEKENISTRLQWGDDTDNGRQILEQVRDSMDMVLQYSR